MTSLPLAGLLIVAVEQAVAAPFATRQLADLGARVVKVERPGGDFARRFDRTVHGQSSHFIWLNRGKESIELDLRSPSGQRVLAALVDRADVFVQNLSPAAASRAGVTAAAMTADRPRLIACDISGYGSGGPYSDRKAYDLLIQNEAGLVSITGSAGEPAKAGISVADIAAGMYAYSGVLTALLRRALTGEATAVEVSLFEALAEWMGAPAYYAGYGGRAPERMGIEHATIAPYGPFAVADGTVLLAVQNDREWAALCTALLGHPELAGDPRFAVNSSRVAHRAQVNALVAEPLGRLPGEAALALLQSAGIAAARINQVSDFLAHPVLAQRHRWREIAVPGGTAQALLPPADLAGIEPVLGPVPAAGQHTGDILRELGRGNAEIDALRRQAVV